MLSLRVAPRRRLALALLPALAAGQMFEIPAEMLGGMFGGMMGGGGGGKPRKVTEWPKTESSTIDPDFEWLLNTEWKGKTAKYIFRSDGQLESPLKECEQDDMCLWAANDGVVKINTPTLKVLKFHVESQGEVDKKKRAEKDETELKKYSLVSVAASKSGKKSVLQFARVDVAAGVEVMLRSLYDILEVEPNAEASAIKSKYRRLSITHHPDKGGDPKAFDEIRQAYEILSDTAKRRYYDEGGQQLVNNMETSQQEVEGQKSQMASQLNQVPKNHPQYQMFKQQIEQQQAQFMAEHSKSALEKKMRSDDIEVFVPVSAQDLAHGARKSYTFNRLVMCKGCRANPDSEACKDCGRCPPEKKNEPKYGNTPFGRQVVGVKEKEQESLEKCRSVPVEIKDLNVKKGAEDGATLRHMADIGHQTPGKLPGTVVFKLQRGLPEDVYSIALNDLHTVLHLTLSQALFGFSVSWSHLGEEVIKISRKRVTQPNEVIRFKGKGLPGTTKQTMGDLYIRLAVDLPSVEQGSASLTHEAPPAGILPANLTREDPVELRDGKAWLRWTSREGAHMASEKKDKDGGKKKKEEL